MGLGRLNSSHVGQGLLQVGERLSSNAGPFLGRSTIPSDETAQSHVFVRIWTVELLTDGRDPKDR